MQITEEILTLFSGQNEKEVFFLRKFRDSINTLSWSSLPPRDLFTPTEN